MVNKSTSLIRRILWASSIIIGVVGFVVMVGTPLEDEYWINYLVVGLCIFVSGSALTMIFNDPIVFLAVLVVLAIVTNCAFYKLFHVRTKTTRRCYRLMRRNDNSLYDIYLSAYDAIYSMHSIETIVHRED